MKQLVADILPDMIAWRHDFHAHPELGYDEHRTAERIATLLREFGCDDVATGIGQTGVVGTIHGHSNQENISGEAAVMLRADMDALPISEETGVAYTSKNPGIMHACGHDGHTTMLLGAAKVLCQSRHFAGTVYVCFQPAEEGGAGAHAMMQDGLFERFPCQAVFGMHNWPRITAGEFGVIPGPIMAAADEFAVKIQGRGGHAAKPDKTRDPIVAGAHIVTALQTIISRQTDPFTPVVVSVTQFHAGTTFNVIPDTALLEGTVRSFDANLHTQTYDHMRRICNGVAQMFDLDITLVRSEKCYPPTVNDAALTKQCVDILKKHGAIVHEDCPPSMGAEDFSYYCQEKPGCFVFLGNGDSYPLHHPKFDFNDDILPIGAEYWIDLVESVLEKNGIRQDDNTQQGA